MDDPDDPIPMTWHSPEQNVPSRKRNGQRPPEREAGSKYLPNLFCKHDLDEIQPEIIVNRERSHGQSLPLVPHRMHDRRADSEV